MRLLGGSMGSKFDREKNWEMSIDKESSVYKTVTVQCENITQRHPEETRRIWTAEMQDLNTNANLFSTLVVLWVVVLHCRSELTEVFNLEVVWVFANLKYFHVYVVHTNIHLFQLWRF